MTLRSTLTVSASALALLLAGNAAHAQTTPAEKAQAAIGTYISIIAVAKACEFDVAKTVRDAVEANMLALQPISGLDDAAIGNGINGAIAKISADKAAVCSMGRAKYDDYLVAQAAKAAELASGTGAKIGPIPVSAAPAAPAVDDPKKAATDLLVLSYLLEAIAEECDSIELTDDETTKLEKAQTFLRAKAGYTEAQVEGLSDTMEKEATKGKKEFCSPAFDFKGQLKTVFDAAK